jgi:hypothetical protein
LKHFIEINAYDNDDIQKQEEVKALSADLNLYQTKKDGITFYQDNDIRRITLFFTILFGILYIGRPLILFIRNLYGTQIKLQPTSGLLQFGLDRISLNFLFAIVLQFQLDVINLAYQ